MSGGVAFKRSRQDGAIANGTGMMDMDPVYYTTTILSNMPVDKGEHGESATFSESRSFPLVPSTYNYSISVESLRVDTKALPSLIADVDQTQTDPTVLKQKVGMDIQWRGSTFPYNGAYADSAYKQVVWVGQSSLPFRFYSQPTQAPSAVYTTNFGSCGQSGTEQFLRINDPTSCEWTGATINNVTTDLLIRQVSMGLSRAFGNWVAADFTNQGLNLPTIPWGLTYNQDCTLMTVGSVDLLTNLPLTIGSLFPVAGTTFVFTNNGANTMVAGTVSWTTSFGSQPVITSLPNIAVGGSYSYTYTGPTPFSGQFLTFAWYMNAVQYSLIIQRDYNPNIANVYGTLNVIASYTASYTVAATPSTVPVNSSTSEGIKVVSGAQVYLDSFQTQSSSPYPLALNGFYVLQSAPLSSGGYYTSFTVKLSASQSAAIRAAISTDLYVPANCRVAFEDYKYTDFTVTITNTQLGTATNGTGLSSNASNAFLNISQIGSWNHNAYQIDFTDRETSFSTVSKIVYSSKASPAILISDVDSLRKGVNRQVTAPTVSFSEILNTASILGFAPNATFQFQLISSGSASQLPRPIAPGFIQLLNPSSTKALVWTPQDKFADQQNPKPYSSYYYGYGLEYFMNNVVNPAFSRVVREPDIDSVFYTSSVEPFVAFATLQATNSNFNAITDLSLEAQLYCMCYYNSSAALLPRLNDLYSTAYSYDTTYTAGMPVVVASNDATSAENLLFIADHTIKGVQPPTNRGSTEDWIYCGTFLYSTAVPNTTYGPGSVVTVIGNVYSNTSVTNNIWSTATYTGGFPGSGWTSLPIYYSATITNDNANNYFQNVPLIGTTPPALVCETVAGDKGDVFTFRLDSYGFGTTSASGYRDPLRAFLRDSWGFCTGNYPPNYNVPAFNNFSASYGRTYDEYATIHSSTEFKDLFNGFDTVCLKYSDPVTGISSAYWEYVFKVLPSMVLKAEGGTQSTQLFGSTDIPAGNNYSGLYMPYLRTSNNLQYSWEFSATETSRYSSWSPVLSIVLEAGVVSMDPQPNSEPFVVSSLGYYPDKTSGRTNKILVETFPSRHPSEGPVIYSSDGTRVIGLTSGPIVRSFSYLMWWRNKYTGELEQLKLSTGGSVVSIFKFTPKV
jgi:hypothetical protein